MSRIAVVGCEASGKTVFMSAMSDFYRPGSAAEHRLCLVPENQSANRFAHYVRRQLRSLRQWPPATNPGKTVALDWTLRDGDRPLVEIGMLEFGGETFRQAFREEETSTGHKQAVKELLGYLKSADFIVVLVSLRELLRDPGTIPMEEFERDAESMWVTRGLLELIRDRAAGVAAVIGLTQADRYRKELADAGGAKALFAQRWPTIHAVAAELPVVEIASVSGVDGEGRPEENFRTDGILPVMREFALESFGDPSGLSVSLADKQKEIESLDAGFSSSAYATKLRKFKSELEDFRCAAAILAENHERELAVFDDAAERFTAIAKANRKTQKPKTRNRRQSRPICRRPFLLAMLLAAVITAGVEYLDYGALSRFEGYFTPEPTRTTTTEFVIVTNTVQQICEIQVTNIVPVVNTIAVTNIVTVTNAVAVTEPKVKPPTLAKTSGLQPVVTTTNGLQEAVTATNTVDSFRVWHDRKGGVIRAKWTATAEDRKSITLITENGRIIKAVLYKFSDEDRRFVEETLTAADAPKGR